MKRHELFKKLDITFVCTKGIVYIRVAVCVRLDLDLFEIRLINKVL